MKKRLQKNLGRVREVVQQTMRYDPGSEEGLLCFKASVLSSLGVQGDSGTPTKKHESHPVSWGACPAPAEEPRRMGGLQQDWASVHETARHFLCDNGPPTETQNCCWTLRTPRRHACSGHNPTQSSSQLVATATAKLGNEVRELERRRTGGPCETQQTVRRLAAAKPQLIPALLGKHANIIVHKSVACCVAFTSRPP